MWFFFFSSRRRHTRWPRDWSSDVCSSDLAIDGAVVAGATEFLVNDSHSTMQNLRPDELNGRASYLSGRHKPMYMMEGLDDSFDAAFFVSYHGSAGSTSSVLYHTYNP